MADWKTYAKAAQRTAQKQAPAAKESLRRGVDDARLHARAAARTADKSTRASRANARRTAAATAVAAQNHYRRANVGTRLKNGVRDALLMALAVFVLWAVISRVAPIPWQAVVIVALALVVVRMAWTLFTIWKPEEEPIEEETDAQRSRGRRR